jgi:hypothetical protein
VTERRVAVVAGADDAALHGLDGRFEWGEGRTFAPDERAELAAWGPGSVFALGVPAPAGPWRTIAWGATAGDRRVGPDDPSPWRRAPVPAADALSELRSRRGAGVFVAGAEAARESALVKLHARGVDAWGAARPTRADLERAAVVALLDWPGAATAVLAAGRVLVAPRAVPGFGLLPWSDHLPYDNEDELACSADVAQSFPEAFETIVAMGVLAAAAHLASAVYGRLAVDAELEDEAGARRPARAST